MIKSKATKTMDFVVAAICFLLILICLLPMINVLARAFSDPDALIRGRVLLWPVGLNFDAFSMVLGNSPYTRSLVWTVILTVICTVFSMVMTLICAYPLSYDHLKGRRFFNTVIILTMYFTAGLIPNYLLLKDLGILNTPSVLIIPNCLSVFNMIILRSFLYSIPESLRESAEIDGANPIRILVSIYVPLSTSVLATLSLFYAVGRWNGYTDALQYMVSREEFYPIQLLLYNMLNSMRDVEVATQEGFAAPGLAETVKAATVVFATVPILIVYPWLQRYFITGVTLGGVKG
jgi:putative aldouronate transport system permease protein